MKLFNRLSICWLILMLYLLLRTVKLVSGDNEVFSIHNDTPKFNHLAVHKDFGTVFASAGNRLYKFSTNLTLLDKVNTTVEPHGMNYNQILIINYRENLLIACGNTNEYMCQTYGSINGESKLNLTEKKRVDGMSEKGSNVSVVGLIADDNWGAKNSGTPKLYIAISYGGYSINIPAITIRELNSRKFDIYSESKLFKSEAFNIHYRDPYAVNYVYGFNSSQYNYFLTTQKKYNREDSPYISKIIRICFNGQSLWQGYAEIPIDCEFEDGNTYNLIQAANVGKPNSQLATSLNINIKDDVLYAVFSKSLDKKGPSNQPSNRSALCIYSLKAIDEKFIENIQNCFNGSGYSGFGNLSSNPKCNETNEHINSTFCSSPVNMPLIGNQSITASPVITFNTHLTAIGTKPIEDHNEVFVGTNTGHLKKIVVKDIYGVCEQDDFTVDEGSPVNSDLLFSPFNTYLYVMTEHKLSRIKAPESLVNCSLYQVNSTCNETALKYCRWCGSLNKCTTRCDCFYKNYHTWQSKSFEEHEKSINEFQIGATQSFQISSTISLGSNTTFICYFTIEGVLWSSFGNVYSKGDNSIICPAPETHNFPKIAVYRNYLNANLLISTIHNQKIAYASTIKFFDCGKYTSSKACMFSTFNCNWHEEKKKCTFTNTTSNYLKTNTIGNTSRTTSIPSGVHSVLNIADANLRICDKPSNFECVINIEGNKYTQKAAIDNCNYSISCEGASFTYAENSSSTLGYVTVERANFASHDILLNTSFVMYKCPLMAQNCSSCLNLKAEYNCGWCQSSKTCKYKSDCDDQLLERSNTCQDSSPIIVSIWPERGTCGGGTNVTITGKNLGNKFEDISQGVTVAGITCRPLRNRYIATMSITCEIGKFTNDTWEGKEGPVEVSINGEHIKSPQNFRFVVPKINGVFISKDITHDHIDMTINGTNLDAGISTNVYIGNASCNITLRNSSTILCNINGSSTKTKARIYVEYDDHVRHLINDSLKHIEKVQRYETPKGIPAGGVKMLIQNITVGINEQLLFHAYFKNQIYNSSCKRESSHNLWSCLSPSTPDINSGSIDADHPIQMNVSFTSNLTNSSTIVDFENNTRKFLLYPNPEFHYFINFSVEFNENREIVIVGKNIDKACQKTDITVNVGNYSCDVTSISTRKVTCSVAKFPSPRAKNESEPKYDFFANLDTITVSIGDNFTVVVRKKQTPMTEKSSLQLFIICAVIIFIIIILIAVIYCFLSKKKIKAKSMKKTQQRMTRLELRVASECKEAFAELQTQATTHMVGDSYMYLPFLSYHTFTMNVLFPKKDDHSFILDGKIIPIHKEKGLILFRELIMDINFIITFVRTLEKEESFTVNDRVLVASIIMITLQKDMKYCTDILQILLAELIDKYMRGNSHPKLLFRKTESIVEKMLSAWFSFLLYQFLTESAGPPLFNLFTVIKEHVNRGPVDMVTSQARYCLSENKLLRHKIEFSSMTIYVNIPQYTAEIIELEMPIEGVPVQVLDCDTISQFKEKALDAIHLTMKYSRNLHSTELIVEWVYDTSTRKILSDDDFSSVTDGEWRQKNTLRHYSVPDGSIFNLISDKETNNRSSDVMSSFSNKESMNTIKRKTSTLPFRIPRKKSSIVSTSALLQGADSQYREWHLIKPHDSCDGHEDHCGSDQMIPEIYLPRLLATKSSLQKFVDELFDVIFKKSNQINCLPVAIKYMFDFLDNQALQHNITDPEVIHVWKNNCLPLRFWVNLIKNPNFLFDVHKSQIVDSCLSVIAQVLMDSCSTSEQHFSKDSATTKLLYAKEIPIYNNMVQMYYADIKNMPKISSQDMNSMLSEESEKYAAYSYTNEAVDELFEYANKYKNKLIDSLKRGGSYEHNVLVLKLEKTITIMSGQI